MKKYTKYIPFLALALAACEPELDNSIDDQGFYTSGDVDVSNFVAVGNSLTAGFADNALYITGQESSYPNILAGQFELAGGGDFTQPLMADNLGGLLLGGQQIAGTRLVLSTVSGEPAPMPLSGTPTTEVTNTLSGSFNNMGVPGAKSYHLVAPGYGNAAGVAAGTANPYYARFASSADATILGDAAAQSPSFFTLWIGNNDILGYALSGGTGVDQTGNLDPSTYASNDITDPNVFASVYSNLVEGLAGSASGGILVNIPDVTTIPYFTTVPHNPIPLDQATADQVNAAYQEYNNGLDLFVTFGAITQEEADRRYIEFMAGEGNAAVIEDEYLTTLVNPLTGEELPKIRQATSEDLVVLPASSIIGTLADPGDPSSVRGVGVPLGDELVLIPEEQGFVATAQGSYNATIRALADQNGLAFVNAQAALSELANGGISFDGGLLTSTFATGGAFSLDGVHPTPRGYAYIANLAIEAMNDTYNANVPKVNIGNYNTVTVSNDVN